MFRRLTAVPVKAAMVAPRAVVQRRSLACNCHVMNAVGAHFGELGNAATYMSVSTLAYSPLGTLALLLVAYNTSVVGVKHCWYTLEMVAKDYVQDIQLQVTLRYVILLALLFGVEGVLVEA